MASTLTYGMQIPANGDNGDIWFPALAANFTALDSHNHDGVNSVKLTSTAFTAEIVSAPSGSWASQGNGTYRQTVTMPAGMDFDDYSVSFRDASTAAALYLSYVKLTNSTFYVYINDNTISLNVLIGA